MSDNPNLALQARFAAAVMSGDFATLRELSHPDFLLEQGSGLPYAGTYHGVEGFIAFLGVFAETYDIERLEQVRNYHCDDPGRIVCEFEMRTVQRANGRRFDSSLLEVWYFRDGKVLGVKPHYFNSPLQS